MDDTTFGPSGTPFLYTAEYPEYDFYAQDTWKLRPNLTIDYGLRYEVRLSPRAPDNTILRPAFPVRAGEQPTNQIRFEEGKLYEDLRTTSRGTTRKWVRTNIPPAPERHLRRPSS